MVSFGFSAMAVARCAASCFQSSMMASIWSVSLVQMMFCCMMSLLDVLSVPEFFLLDRLVER
jgi:hypothetical protein